MLSKEILKSIKSLKPTFFKNTVKDIFSFKELEKQLNLRPFVNNSRFTPVHSKPYAWKASGWLSDKNSFPPFVIKDILKTSVCYLRDASRANKKLNTICKEIEEATHWPTDAHIYFSVKETENSIKGFGKHKDHQHNLIICVEGSYEITIYDLKDKKIINKILKSGNGVFIPANHNHEINSLSKRLSISFAMAPYESIFQEREWISL